MSTNKHYLIIIFFIATSILIISNIRSVKINVNLDSFLQKDDPAYMTYMKYREIFSSDESVIIGIKSDKIFSYDFFKMLNSLNAELELIENVTEVNSLLDIKDFKGEGDTLVVTDLLEGFNEYTNYESLRDIVTTNPLYKNYFISESGNFTLILVSIKTIEYISNEDSIESLLEEFDSETKAKVIKKNISDDVIDNAVSKIKRVLDKYSKDTDYKFMTVGTRMIIYTLKGMMLRDMRLFVILLFIVITVILFITFQRLSGVLLPLLLTFLSLGVTLGSMGLFNIEFTITVVIMPSLLLTINTAASIHILNHFFHHYDLGLNKKDSLKLTFKQTKAPIIFASLTTAAGFMSFSPAKIAPVSHLGIFATLGVLISLLYMLFLLPSLIMVLPLKRRAHLSKSKFLKIVMLFFSRFSIKYPKTIVVVSSIIIVISCFLFVKINVTHNPIAWFPDNITLPKDIMVINDDMGGSLFTDIIVDTKKKNGIYNYKLLEKLDNTIKEIETDEITKRYVSESLSLIKFLKEVNKALNFGEDEYYIIPQNDKAVAEEIFLMESNASDELSKIIDNDYRIIKFSIKTKWYDATKLNIFIKRLREILDRNLTGTDYKVTGIVTILAETLYATLISTLISYLIAFFSIAIMMIILLKNIKLGLISMIPNIFPILVVVSIMSIFGIDADMFILLIGCIIIGLAVDDTLHFIYNFQRFYKLGNSPESAIKKTFLTTGNALFLTSFILFLGFSVFAFATMKNLIYFGVLASTAVLSALLADFLLSPAIMFLLYKNKYKSKKDK